MIDHIELVLGPGSVLYGGNAMIGVVNVVTKRAAAWKGIHVTAEGSLSPEHGRNGSFTSFAPRDLGGAYRLGLGFGHEWMMLGLPAELTAQVELYAQNGPTFLWGPQTGTNDDGSPRTFGPRTPPGVWGGRVGSQYDTFVPTLYSRLMIGDLAVMFRMESYKRRTPTVNGFNQVVTDFDEPKSWERDRWVSIDVQYRKRVGERLRLSARAYADAYDYLQRLYSSDHADCDPATTGACVLASHGRSRWLGAELQAEYDWLGGERLTTLFGVNGTIRGIAGETDSVDDRTGDAVGVDGAKSLTEVVGAAYVQQRWVPVPILHLNGGARFDTDPRGGDRLSPRAATAIDIWHGGVLKAVYSEAFRAPTFYEAFYQSPEQIPNPSIRSETVRGVEGSLEQRAGRHRFLFGAFRTWWSDMLSLRAVSEDVYQYENVSRIDNYGYNARIDGAIGNVRYGASITGAYTRKHTPDGDSPLPVAPQLFGNARAAYVLPGNLPTIALAVAFVGKRPADRALDGNFAPTPYAPGGAELRLTLSQKIAAVPGLSYRLGASYSTMSTTPYVAGPIQGYDAADPARGPAELTPVVRLTGFATLRYEIAP